MAEGRREVVRRQPPDYAGGSLINLVAELEHRLTGSAESPLLHRHLAALMPDAPSYVVVVLDGLGAGQLDHPRAATLARSSVATLDAPFPTTTTVALASVATGLSPLRHGLLGYQLWLPELGVVANTIKWTTLWGEPLAVDTGSLLPAPNLWERLAAHGVEPITVQPAGFAGSPLSSLLYRGCRFEAAATVAELVAATVQLAALPGRLIVTYLPHVDFAAHVRGRHAPEYADAVGLVDTAWSRLAALRPAAATVLGTADHGHVDFPPDRQVRIPRADHEGRIFYGDGRAMYVRGDGAPLAKALPAVWVPIEELYGWWGPGPAHPAVHERQPDGALVADDGYLLLHRHSDDRMIGNHGGLTYAERTVPLLLASG